jgi:NIPSNAP
MNPSTPPAIVELRQYTLHPGRRDALIALFDRELVAPQEALGMTVLGQFRDLDDPDRFVWLRAFASLPARAQALAAFYDGPVWRAHRDAANATMIDSDNVLLLRPAGAAAMPIDAWRRDTGAARDGALLAIVGTPKQDFTAAIGAAGGALVARYETAPTANNFPRLPVREGEPVAVWLARFGDLQTGTRLAIALTRQPRELAPTQCLRLQPTAASRF